MDIYYVYTINDRKSGVSKKITGQIKTLNILGLSTHPVEISSKNSPFASGMSFFKKIGYSYSFIKMLQKIKITLSVAKHSDIIYMRYPLPFFSYPISIFKKKNRAKIIFEHNAIEINEFKLQKKINIFPYYQELLFGRILRKIPDAYVCVTDEIKQHELSQGYGEKIPSFALYNGIDVLSFPNRNNPDNTEQNVILLCVAEINRWHGFDRLIAGIGTYQGNIPFLLHIVGSGQEIENLKEQVKKLGIVNKIIFHGFTTGAALDNLFNICHIAVGSLGIHRIGLTESSTLKVREYCARGIPWIIACEDPDFPDDFPYIHRIPADESPVNIEKVIEFAKRVYADPDHPQKLREYAVEHLDWSVKMKKLKAFLESLVEESPSEA